MKQYKVGIIGFGFMGKTHTYAYKSIPLFYQNLPFGIRLGTVCTAHEETARAAMESCGFEKWTTDPDDIFNDPAIDIVNICTPNTNHKQLILKALAAGKHIYCDKPLTGNAAEVDEIMAAVKSHPELTTQMALQNRFYPAVMKAKELIEAGRIGRVYHFRSEYLHSSGIDPNKKPGWKQMAEFGGGVQQDLASHAFDLVYYLLGEFSEVNTVKETAYASRTAEDASFNFVRLKDGTPGEIFVSKIATGSADELNIDIRGEKGALRFSTADSSHLYYFDATVKDEGLGSTGFMAIDCQQKYPEPGGYFPSPKNGMSFLRAHTACVYNFLAAVDKGVQTSPDIAEGAYVQKALEGIL